MMLKSFALGATLLVTSLSALAQADEINIEGTDLDRDIHCTSSDVNISGANNTIALTGTCKNVLVYGSNHSVTLEHAEKLFVAGSANKVKGGTSEHLQVDLVDNDIHTTLKPGADGPSTLNVTGSKNAVTVTLEGKTVINVAGSDHKVAWDSGQNVAPPKVEMSGIKNSVKRNKR
jgi:hypothetical protein